MSGSENGGTRPHFYVDHVLHGAVKDIADAHDINHAEAYELATRVFVALLNGGGYDPRPDDEDLASIFDHVLDNCETNT